MHPEISRHRGVATRRDPKVFTLYLWSADGRVHRLPSDNVQITPDQVWIEGMDGVHNMRVLQRVADTWVYCGPGDVIGRALDPLCPFAVTPYAATLPPPTVGAGRP